MVSTISLLNNNLIIIFINWFGNTVTMSRFAKYNTDSKVPIIIVPHNVKIYSVNRFVSEFVRLVHCTLLEVGRVYREHTTPRRQMETTRSNRRLNFCKLTWLNLLKRCFLCHLIILFSINYQIRHLFIPYRSNKHKTMIICYQNNIENQVGHTALAAPPDCLV